MIVGQKYIAYMNAMLMKYKPTKFYFKDWMYNLLPGAVDKPSTVKIQVVKGGEGTQYDSAVGYDGTEMEVTYESVEFDINLGNKQVADKKVIRDAAGMKAKFNSICMQNADDNDSIALNKMAFTRLYDGAGTKVSVATANINALNIVKEIKKGITAFYNVDVNDVNDWSLDTTEFKIAIPFRISALILEAYESNTIKDIQGSVTVVNGVITKIYGCDVIVVPDAFAKSKFDWTVVNGKKLLREHADAKPVLFALIANNKPDKPVFVIDKQFVDTGNGEDTNKSGYYFNYRTSYACKVMECKKKGVYVAIESDVEPTGFSLPQGEQPAPTKATSGVI